MNEYRIRSIIRCDLLPTSEMILSMSKEFGVPLNTLDENFAIPNSSTNEKHDNVSEMNIINDNEEYGYERINTIPHTSRIWTPIDNDNDKFIREKQERLNNPSNFLLNNIQNIQEASEHNK